jgi:hypothetical protein
MKRAEDEPRSAKTAIVRVVEQGRIKTKGKIMFSPELNVIDVKLVDLVERDAASSKTMDISRKDGVITSCAVEWNPHEILTFKITRA